MENTFYEMDSTQKFTGELPQGICILKANCYLKVHNVHLLKVSIANFRIRILY